MIHTFHAIEFMVKKNPDYSGLIKVDHEQINFSQPGYKNQTNERKR